MPTPASRTPVRIARGTYANLAASLADLNEGEICFATDEEALYVKNGGSLVASGGTSVTTSDTAPSTPSDGDLWYDSISGRLFIYYQDPSGSQWVDASPQGGGSAGVTISDSAPSTPASGNLWYRSSDGRLYVYYNDGSTSQWVDASPQGGGGSGTSITTGNTTAEVIDTGSDGRFVVTTEGTEALRVDSSRRLLVGTNTARSNFYNQNATTAVQIEGTTLATASLSITRNSNSASSADLIFAKTRGTSVGDNTVVQNGDLLGYIAFQGADGTECVDGAAIECRVDGTPGANDMPGRLGFYTTADGAAGPTERFRINSSGQFFLNTTSSSGFVTDGGKFYLRNSGECMAIYNDTGSGWNMRHNATSNAGTFYFISFAAAGTGVGGITSNSTTTTYGTTSDYRLKENVQPIANAVDRLKQLNPCKFNFIAAPERTVDGFLAHEVQAHVPEAVVGEKDAVDENGEPIYQNIDQSKLVPLLTAALQEAVARIEAQDTTIASLEARLTALEGGN